MSDLIKDRKYEDCFVYQCLTDTCHGASLDREKFINVCLECPCFCNWFHSVEPKTGKWIPDNEHVLCSVCQKEYDWTSEAQYYKFCPTCGAKMSRNVEE